MPRGIPNKPKQPPAESETGPGAIDGTPEVVIDQVQAQTEPAVEVSTTSTVAEPAILDQEAVIAKDRAPEVVEGFSNALGALITSKRAAEPSIATPAPVVEVLSPKRVHVECAGVGCDGCVNGLIGG